MNEKPTQMTEETKRRIVTLMTITTILSSVVAVFIASSMNQIDAGIVGNIIGLTGAIGGMISYLVAKISLNFLNKSWATV